MKLVSNNAKAARVLNWGPAVPLDAGLSKVIAFVSENISLYSPKAYAI